MINRLEFDGDVYVKVIDVEQHLIELGSDLVKKTGNDEELNSLYRQSCLTLKVVTDFLATVREFK